MDLFATARDSAIDDAVTNEFVGRTDAMGRRGASGANRVTTSMDLEQICHRRAGRTGHTFQHGKGVELGNLPRIDLMPAVVDGLHAADSGTDDARGSIRLHVRFGESRIAYCVDRGDAVSEIGRAH